jgi:hypothetical protein
MKQYTKVQEVIEDFFKELEPEELEYLQMVKEKRGLNVLHHSVGRYIRNMYSLWTPDSSALKRDIWDRTPDKMKKLYNAHWMQYGETYQGETMHPDDASTELLRLIAKELK